MSIRGLTILLLAVSAILQNASAQDKPIATPAAAHSTNAPIKEISPGIFEVGKVRLDKKSRTISFPAAINMNENLVEYLLVTTGGKTHESLLSTEVEPYHIQVAMLLLGARGAPPAALTNMPPGGQIIGNKGDTDQFPPIPGDPVGVSVAWKDKNQTNPVPIEDLIFNLRTKSPMTRGDFTFNGSRVWEGTFIAQREGSIISAIADPDAIFNNPRPGRENDEIWQLATNKIPALKTPVTVTITLKSGNKQP